jgi:fused signal recognition particle receptor
MDRLGRWFGRSKNPPAEEPSTTESPEVEVAAPLASGVGENHQEPPREASPPAVPNEAAPATNASGGLRGIWEATRRLALTPVDPFFEKMAEGLNRTRQNLVGQVVDLFRSHGKIDEELWEDLEAILLTADVGVGATDRILEALRGSVHEKKLREPSELLDELREVMGRILGADTPQAGALKVEKGRVNVVLLVGVNGTGKTTTTAKLAHHYQKQGFKVLLAAADTFRAAAIDQLQVWADRLGVDLVRHREGSDPAAVVYDAIAAAQARGVDLVLVDTAGRLHSKANLMEELKKIRRVSGKDLPDAPHEVLLVLDATTGQNALEQARVFHQATELTGLVLCKLDGTARGGIIVAIAQEFQIPVKYIGVGEGLEDLQPFIPQQFLEALFEQPSEVGEESRDGQKEPAGKVSEGSGS